MIPHPKTCKDQARSMLIKLLSITANYDLLIFMLQHASHTVLLSLTPDGLPVWKYFFFVRTGLGWVGGTAGLTGDGLIIILSVMVLCSLPWVRRKGYFEVSLKNMRGGSHGVAGL